LGDGTQGTDRFAPVAVNDSIQFTALSVSSTHSCGISTAGRLWCWGRNTDSELGADSTASQYLSPVPVASTDTLGFPATAVATGAFHTCAVSVGRTYCWGADLLGQIGNGTTSATAVALPTIIDSTLSIVALGADSASTVALGSGNKEYWWGSRGSDLSAPAAVDRSVQPKPVPTYLFSSFATGQSVNCGIYTRNYVFCWGSSTDPNFPAADLPAGVPAP
ncbi:MAG: RCC1 domain-containing protein, partial [Gemmatimonadales bacterium]